MCSLYVEEATMVAEQTWAKWQKTRQKLDWNNIKEVLILKFAALKSVKASEIRSKIGVRQKKKISPPQKNGANILQKLKKVDKNKINEIFSKK